MEANHEADHHDPELPFSCSSCDFRASDQSRVDKHYIVHHEDYIQCAHCIVMVRKHLTAIHERDHHTESLPFTCPENCGFRY